MNSLDGIVISGVCTVVPSKVLSTVDCKLFENDEASKFEKLTGIRHRRVVDDETCSSDLCLDAAETLLSRLKWHKSEVDLIVMVTQSGDYPIPSTSITLQERLGLSTSVIAFDVNLGCSSYPNGIAIVGSLMKALGLEKGLLIVGDTSSKLCSSEDKSTWPLFGDAGSATAISNIGSKDKIFFDFNSDGSGKEAIIIKSGGLASRNPCSPKSLDIQDISHGIRRSESHLQMLGTQVFSFAIKEVPNSINKCLERAGVSSDAIDYIVLHQANKLINSSIVKKTGFAEDKALTSLSDYGNTSSVTIPLTLCLHSDKLENGAKLVLSGFGIGLSWATCVLDLAKNTPLILKDFQK